MTKWPGIALPEITVLVADGDLFEADYVSAVLAARGIRVVGPFADTSKALAAMRADKPQAAVVAHAGILANGGDLVAELEGAGVPYLTLLHNMPRGLAADKPILAPPFAAYQVADWVLNTVGRKTLEWSHGA